MTHLLDNPAWNALNSGNKNFAQGIEGVKFYPTDVSPFAGMEHNTDENLRVLYDIIPGDDSFSAIINLVEFDIPKPWKIVNSIRVLQMICTNPIQRKTFTEPIISLSEEHVSQMLSLTQLTNPGPFKQRTIDFGHYQGIFDRERLVAMAGQRMHILPYAEISAVCTHFDYLGRGYAAQLILNQINRIKEAGEIPFLHVTATNQRAVKLYESLGFVTRKELVVNFIKK